MPVHELDEHIARRAGKKYIPIVSYDPLIRLSYTKEVDYELSKI